MIKLLNLEFKRNKSLSNSYHKYFTCVKYPDFHLCFNYGSLVFQQVNNFSRSTIVNCNLCEDIDVNSRSDVKFQNIIKKNIDNIAAQLACHFEKIKRQNLVFNEFSDSLDVHKILS